MRLRARDLLVGIFWVGVFSGSVNSAWAEDLEEVVRQLQEQEGLTEEEARDIAQEAAADVERELPVERERSADMTPEEQAIADTVETRAHELAAQGLSGNEIDKTLRNEFEKEFQQWDAKAQEGRNQEWSARERDDSRLRELYQEGRPVGEALEHRESGPSPKEMSEQAEKQMREYSGPEREERQIPMMERPEMEPPTLERPEIEHPMLEVEHPEMEQSREGSGMEGHPGEGVF